MLWPLQKMLCLIRCVLSFSTLLYTLGASPQIIDTYSFRNAFGENIPRGYNRRDLSCFTKALKDDTEKHFFRLPKDQDVFLCIDGGTLNRRRLLNTCVAFNGSAFFFPQSIRVPNLTATQVCLKSIFFIKVFLPPSHRSTHRSKK